MVLRAHLFENCGMIDLKGFHGWSLHLEWSIYKTLKYNFACILFALD